MSAADSAASFRSRFLPSPGPVRRLAVLTLVNTTGNGIFFTLGALYFTRILGFSVVSVGFGLSLAAAAGILAGVPIGHLADRRGSREVLIATLLASAASGAALLVVHTYWQFVLVAAVFTFFGSGANTARNALIGGLVVSTRRTSTRAYLRSITNIGITLGTGLAAIALHFDTRSAYLAVLYVNAFTYLACAVLARGLSHVEETPDAERKSMFAAARDLPYVVVTLVGAVLAMHYWIVEIAIPLWVVDRTDAPRWLVSVLVVINAVVVVFFQVGVARRVTTLRSAVAAAILSGLLFLVACGLFGLSGSVGAGMAIGVLIAAATVHVMGELGQAASSFLLSYDLAPPAAVGQYQGLYATGMSLTAFVAPSVMALLPLRMGVPGWWLLGAILLASSLLLAPAVAWAARTRRRYGVAMGQRGPE